VSEQQQINFEHLHEDWVEKRELLDQLIARYIAPPSEGAGMTIEMPREGLALDIVEELSLARENESEAWNRLIASLRQASLSE
jgi:hypothetical protein